MSISKALVFEGCSKPQTNLKSIIGTGTWDRLHSVCSASEGVISYSALGCGAPPSLKTQSRGGMNYWFCYSDQLSSLSSPDFVQTHNYIGGDLTGQKKKNPLCLYFLTKNLPQLHQARRVKWGSNQCIPNVSSHLFHSHTWPLWVNSTAGCRAPPKGQSWEL